MFKYLQEQHKVCVGKVFTMESSSSQTDDSHVAHSRVRVGHTWQYLGMRKHFEVIFPQLQLVEHYIDLCAESSNQSSLC